MKSLDDVIEVRLARHTQQGSLVVLEGEKDIPFKIQRMFFVTDVPPGETRGRHAHRQCNQVFLCQKGTLKVTCDDGKNQREFVLDRPDRALVVPASIWAEETYGVEGSTLLVLADQPYDPQDYVHSYDEFISWRGLA